MTSTITMDRDGGHFPNPAEFAVALAVVFEPSSWMWLILLHGTGLRSGRPPAERPQGGGPRVHEARGRRCALPGCRTDGADSASLGRCIRMTVHGWRS